jgi:hypothetical protein
MQRNRISCAGRQGNKYSRMTRAVGAKPFLADTYWFIGQILLIGKSTRICSSIQCLAGLCQWDKDPRFEKQTSSSKDRSFQSLEITIPKLCQRTMIEYFRFIELTFRRNSEFWRSATNLSTKDADEVLLRSMFRSFFAERKTPNLRLQLVRWKISESEVRMCHS